MYETILTFVTNILFEQGASLDTNIKDFRFVEVTEDYVVINFMTDNDIAYENKIYFVSKFYINN